jgi:hypothetical protein
MPSQPITRQDDLILRLLGDVKAQVLLTSEIKRAVLGIVGPSSEAPWVTQFTSNSVDALVEAPNESKIHPDWALAERRLVWLTLACCSPTYRTHVERNSSPAAPLLWCYLTAVFDGFTMGLDSWGNTTTNPAHIRFKTVFDVVEGVRNWYARL